MCDSDEEILCSYGSSDVYQHAEGEETTPSEDGVCVSSRIPVYKKRVSNNATVYATRSLGTVKLDFWGMLLVNAKDNYSCTVPDDCRFINAYVLAPILFVYFDVVFFVHKKLAPPLSAIQKIPIS
ncbi:hypothetical protein FQA39_LY01190 [Lamprigera yunnana]|nr:hypothetical protein FQA39_LY01190 [Lamprigera yunnana]